jgi:hypothetical protein
LKISDEFQDGVMTGYMEHLEEIKNAHRILFSKAEKKKI